VSGSFALGGESVLGGKGKLGEGGRGHLTLPGKGKEEFHEEVEEAV